MLRDLRARDAGRVFGFLKSEFPAEEALLGTRPEGFEKVVRRVFRWDARLVLGILRIAGRPLYRFFVVAEDGRIVGTTLLTFPESAGYVSMVVVDPAQRRRGHARRLLEAARAATQRRGRPFVALDVLETNAPARALYASLGYRELRATGYFVRDAATDDAGARPTPASIRGFHRSDAEPLAALAQGQLPSEVGRVLPIRARDLVGSSWVNAMLSSESAAWVVDRGRGPEAHVSATRTPTTEAGHLSAPIVGEHADPAAVAALVRTALDWLAARGAPRAVVMVPESNASGRSALEEAGFHRAIEILTLYRPSA